MRPTIHIRAGRPLNTLFDILEKTMEGDELFNRASEELGELVYRYVELRKIAQAVVNWADFYGGYSGKLPTNLEKHIAPLKEELDK